MLSDLMERDREQLHRLEAERPGLYRAYVEASERLRTYESEEWRAFQLL